MSKKTLIIIIAVLAVVLVAGIVAIFVLPDPVAPDDAVSSMPTEQETGEAVQETDAVGEPVEPELPAGDDTPVATAGEDSVTPTKKPDAVDPTSPTKDTTGTITKPTTPRPTEPEETEPEKPYFPEATGTPAPEKDEVTYLEYHEMSATEQKAFINTFESYDAFFEWHDAAKKAYEDSLIEIDGSTPVDMEDFAGGD